MSDHDPLIVLQKVEAARRAVEPFAGAMDGIYTTPGEVYRRALRQMGFDTKALQPFDHTDAARQTFIAVKSRPRPKAKMAADSATLTARAAMFPHANRLGRSA